MFTSSFLKEGEYLNQALKLIYQHTIYRLKFSMHYIFALNIEMNWLYLGLENSVTL